MELLFLDLATTNIPFLVQTTKADGDKVNPTVDSLIIYEEGGADTAFDSTTIEGSPFDPAQVNSKTGLWGVLVPKSAFTAGKFYIALWELTVDSKTTAKVERYFVVNSSSFKATGFSTHTAADVKDAIEADGSKLDAVYDKLPSGNISDFSGGAVEGVTNPVALTAAYDAAKTAAQAGGSMVASNMVAAPDNAGVAAIKAKTDKLTFTVDDKVISEATIDAATIADQLIASGVASQETLDEIAAKIITGVINVVSPVSADGQTVELMQGDDYLAIDSNALVWQSDDWKALNTTKIELFIYRGPTLYLTKECDIDAVTGTITVELTRDETRELGGMYSYNIQATLATESIKTLVTIGELRILDDEPQTVSEDV